MATLPARYPVLESLFLLLGWSMLAFLAYTISIHGLHCHIDLFTLWGLDWIGFKEENLITVIIWFVLLLCFRSITMRASIVLQFSKPTAAEALQNPIDYVKLQNSTESFFQSAKQKLWNAIRKRRCSRVVVAIVVFSTLGILICGPAIYVLAIDHGSHVSKDLLTAWLVAEELNINIIIFVLVGWGNYKEMRSCADSVIRRAALLLVLFGSATASCYIMAHLLETAVGLVVTFI